MNYKQDQERVKDLIKDTLTLLCKNGLHFNKNFLIEGLIGITLDDDQIFLINIKEQFVSSVYNYATKDIPVPIHSKSVSDKKNKASDDAPIVDESQNDKDDLKIEHISDIEEEPLISNSNNDFQNRISDSGQSTLMNNKNISRKKFKETISSNVFPNNSKFIQSDTLSIENDNFNLDNFQPITKIPKIIENTDFDMDSYIDESIDEKNVIQIKDEDDTENEDSSYQMYDEESGPSFESFQNLQTSFESMPTSNQILKDEQIDRIEQQKMSVIKRQCLICGLRCKQTRITKAHMSQVHGFPREFKCNLCSKEFLYRSNLKDHMLKKHNNLQTYIIINEKE